MASTLKFLIVLGLLATGAAYVTKPDQTRAEAALKSQLLSALEHQEPGNNRSTASNLALMGCKLQPDGCYDLVRSGIDAQFSDHVVYTRYTITGFGKTADCIGAFTTFICPKGLIDN